MPVYPGNRPGRTVHPRAQRRHARRADTAARRPDDALGRARGRQRPPGQAAVCRLHGGRPAGAARDRAGGRMNGGYVRITAPCGVGPDGARAGHRLDPGPACSRAQQGPGRPFGRRLREPGRARRSVARAVRRADERQVSRTIRSAQPPPSGREAGRRHDRLRRRPPDTSHGSPRNGRLAAQRADDDPQRGPSRECRVRPVGGRLPHVERDRHAARRQPGPARPRMHAGRRPPGREREGGRLR
jgi:hypothetical protein